VSAFRTPTISRFLVVAVMLLSWVVITNHCALARMQAQMAAQDEAECCHKKGQASEKEAPCRELARCCQAVKASLSGKAEVKFDASKFQVQFFAILQAPTAQNAKPAQDLVFDHGPPRAVSFAESVLQRSLLSHAPPFAA
jgi:hypothetical protein